MAYKMNCRIDARDRDIRIVDQVPSRIEEHTEPRARPPPGNCHFAKKSPRFTAFGWLSRRGGDQPRPDEFAIVLVSREHALPIFLRAKQCPQVSKPAWKHTSVAR